MLETDKQRKHLYDQQRYYDNIESVRIRSRKYYVHNRIACLQKVKQNSRRYYRSNIVFKLKSRISSEIRKALINQNSSKCGKSISNYLSYSMLELKQHLENLFESWMNWQNHGIYKIEAWNDKDKSTWTWQIDHVIPQSQFKYTSMEDNEFKKCWALNNLRPLSSKQNVIDGNRRNKEE